MFHLKSNTHRVRIARNAAAINLFLLKYLAMLRVGCAATPTGANETRARRNETRNRTRVGAQS